MAWRSARDIFTGGTEEAKRLIKKRVRSITQIVSKEYDPVNNKPEEVTISPASTGFVSQAQMDTIFVAYPKIPGTQVRSLDELVRHHQFFVVALNWATFQWQFQVEV